MHKLILVIIKMVTSCYSYCISPVQQRGVLQPVCLFQLGTMTDKPKMYSGLTAWAQQPACFLLVFCSLSVLTSTIKTPNSMLSTVFFQTLLKYVKKQPMLSLMKSQALFAQNLLKCYLCLPWSKCITY